MSNAVQDIYDALTKEAHFMAEYEDRGEVSETRVQFGLPDGGSYYVHFIGKERNDIAVRVFRLTFVHSITRKAALVPVLNHLNNKYRYMKLVLDEDGYVNMEYDYPLHCPDPSASALELLIRFSDMVDEIYPELIQALCS